MQCQSLKIVTLKHRQAKDTDDSTNCGVKVEGGPERLAHWGEWAELILQMQCRFAMLDGEQTGREPVAFPGSLVAPRCWRCSGLSLPSKNKDQPSNLTTKPRSTLLSLIHPGRRRCFVLSRLAALAWKCINMKSTRPPLTLSSL